MRSRSHRRPWMGRHTALFAPLLFLSFSLLPAIATAASSSSSSEQRHKSTDENYQPLIPIKDIPVGCDSTDNGYGIIDGGLEKCDVYLKAGGDKNEEENNYEKFKCEHLRVHAKLNAQGKCECTENWKGHICNEYIGCPEGFSLYAGVCTPNSCQHDGQLALGSQRVECICKAPWDGVFCERLACWRMASKEHERRWRNSGDHCRCADGFEGDQCDKIAFCKNGELASRRCICAEGWKGEICERKCIPNQTCASPSRFPTTAGGILFLLTLLLPTLLVPFIFRDQRP